ncbi:hypothetical protein GQ53DRAFT_745680 [Thozetella sp. PMI_491]|nr:hypothetical protein GQ53DRAFT_745680 [Thozetella sp. PMI_491]
MGKKGPAKAPAPRSTKAAADKERNEKPQATKEEITAQQRLLDIFAHSFQDVIASDTFTATLQDVKQGLFNREFAAAFGTQEKLEVYAARWSPTRALCYAHILKSVRPHLGNIFRSDGVNTEANPPAVWRVLSIGGGAAEAVAFGAAVSELEGVSADVTLLDLAPWGEVVSKLETALTTPPPLSKYASAAAKEANAPLLEPSRVTCRFLLQDILELEKAKLAETIGPVPCLVTLLFTLNELFTSSGIGKTTKFLLDLTSVLPIGSLLLVVDSPGSYSETSVGKQEKRYPMQWLLDKVLMATEADPIDGRQWVRLESDDSVWFRLAEGLRYPMALENMRYQMHIYRVDEVAS